MRYFFLPYLLFCFLAAGAQRQPDTSLFRKPAGFLGAVTFSPLALAQIDYTLMAGAEKWISRRFDGTLESGWIFASDFLGREGRQGESGFNIRPGIKYFITPTRRGYLQGQVFYKQVTHRLYDWLQKDVVNGVPSYEQLQDFKYRRKVHGYNLMLGVMVPLNRERKLFLDMYFGLGVRYKWSSIVGEKRSRYPGVNTFLIADFEREGATLPSVPAGFRIFYNLR